MSLSLSCATSLPPQQLHAALYIEKREKERERDVSAATVESTLFSSPAFVLKRSLQQFRAVIALFVLCCKRDWPRPPAPASPLLPPLAAAFTCPRLILTDNCDTRVRFLAVHEIPSSEISKFFLQIFNSALLCVQYAHYILLLNSNNNNNRNLSQELTVATSEGERESGGTAT